MTTLDIETHRDAWLCEQCHARGRGGSPAVRRHYNQHHPGRMACYRMGGLLIADDIAAGNAEVSVRGGGVTAADTDRWLTALDAATTDDERRAADAAFSAAIITADRAARDAARAR